MKAFLILAVAVLLAGCSGNERADDVVSDTVLTADSFDPSIRTNRLSTEEFFKLIFSDYDKAGRKNPKWDKEAKEFFALLGMSGGTNEHTHEQHERLVELRTQLQRVGCEDPLVRYMILRQTKEARRAGAEGTNEWTQVALDLNTSAYHSYWMFFSHMRAAQAHKSTSGTSNSTEVITFRNRASDRLIELLKDWRVPPSVVHESAYVWLTDILSMAPKLRKYTYDEIEPYLLAGWGDTAEAHLIRGGYHVRYAWDARGGGWANTVSEEGWRLMHERLGIAREALEHSWSIRPMLDTALQMQWVELGDSRGREEMERWFNNAMKLSPGNYDARVNKLYWLHEKWHGSVKDMLNFGKESLSDTNETAALTLYEVHLELAKYHKLMERGTEADYLRRPEVWRDIKLSFETFLAAHPDAVGWRHDYALAAYKSEAWDDLRKQIKLMGPINYAYFGGKEAYEEMVRKAEQYGKEPVSP